MRTNKELIQIAIDNFEYDILLDLIKNNATLKKWYNIFNWGKPNYISNLNGSYFWEIGLKEPRLKYLDYLLNKYENEN